MESREQIDGRFMQRALELTRAAPGLASPNPQVGCVIVRDNRIVGEGAHIYDERDHAEIVALRHARERGTDLSGATAYVTLEPCSHHGRTGPCADALIAAGVRRVVVATVDPNPQVSGRGIARLRAAGIDVTVGVLQPEARAINDAFARFIQTGRPLVTLKAALSADGMLAPPASARTARQPHWLTGPQSRAEVQRLRHAADAVLTGIGTVLADDPLLTDRSGLPRRRSLLRVVLDSRLRTPLDSQLVRSAHDDLLIFCDANAEPDHAAALESAGVAIERIAQRGGRLDLHAVLAALAARQIISVLLECGSELNGAFLAQNLVDKVVLFHAPAALGDGAIPFAAGLASPSVLEQSLKQITRRNFGPDICVAGTLRDPWASVSD
ncbi:MAG: bifunctional diaminohydroxyphosphoribosylaminopyrimidine deaminase/5-amino-6-(5-phosphoribosylamino)uracil reductase RibD [Acidobacteriaceae bacterium]|jgi:diaminohydroxyphosphoribosylaminopyrimidine deaminase/5-amino-6-(5-phosphoribosylamino)uracil reductase